MSPRGLRRVHDCATVTLHPHRPPPPTLWRPYRPHRPHLTLPTAQRTASKTSGINKKKSTQCYLCHIVFAPPSQIPTTDRRERRNGGIFIFPSHDPPPPPPRIPKPISSYPFDLIAQLVCSIPNRCLNKNQFALKKQRIFFHPI